MKLIVLDFLRRWWLLMAIFVLLTLISTTMRYPIVFSIFAIFALFFDAQRGLLHTARTLPISRRVQALTGWFIAVIMLPLMALLILPLGILLEMSPATLKTYGVLRGEPWFAAAAAWWLQLGFGALLFSLFALIPTRTPVTVWEKITGVLLGLCIPLGLFGSIGFVQLLPRSTAQLTTLHWILFLLVPGLVLLSILVAPETVKPRQRSAGALRSASAPPVEEKINPRSLTGVSLLIVKMNGLALGIYALVMASTWAVAWFLGRENVMQNLQRADHQTFMFVIIIAGGIIPNTFNLRMLRVMPLSTRRLTMLLLSVPAAIGSFSTLIALIFGTFVNNDVPLLLNCAVKAATITGLGGMMLAISLYLSSSSGLIGLVMATVLATSAFDLIPPIPPLLALVLGLTATAAAFLLLQWILKRSSKAYRLRRQFGMPLGQPATAR